ncbi:TetR/AcrR family transcriptional regulator [Paenibacillus doosanensis]|uniref:HTH-type transcriptional repressor ComR n=1 Tax=Paenibacillus konkukensis TaxID=2020716 RepID=A0ABY4RIW4_9BACL|nr:MULTISPECIES: TetR/AcrR family transcriptional regulator [Paenibacillus]MCS7463814.1 TetR/AcrR family transcriptional regulator [Paenibacillus doosanensis]UQZ81367.1 HTH-type transcriptional repressor ComR [Paenibacillus konkukensis]
MVRPREFDKEKALEAALRVFWDKGYEAASLTDLTQAMGIQRPSLYAAFGDKKELFEAALRQYTKQHAAYVRGKLQSGPSVKEAIRRFLADVIEEGYGSRPPKGCFCINTMVELAPHDERFEVLTREHQMYLAAIFQEAVECGQRSGELGAGTDARALAQALVISLIGLTVMTKSRPERAFMDRSADMLLSLLK